MRDRTGCKTIKDIYLVHVDGYIGAYKPGRCPMISYAKQSRFIDFVESLREDYPGFRLRCVVNEGISERIRGKIKQDMIFEKMLAKKYNNR